MKIRSGFVSNSSSSSFICDVCGENVSGMDICLSEAEMCECSKGHTVCDSHLDKSLEDAFNEMSLEEKKEYCKRFMYGEERKLEVDNLDEDGLEDLYLTDIESESRYEMPSKSCPCCNLTIPTTKQLLDFMLYDKGTTIEEVESDLRSRFKDYEEFLSKKATP